MVQWDSMEETYTSKTSLAKTQTTTHSATSATSLLLKATLLSLVFAGIMLLITAFGTLIFGYSRLQQFAKKAHTTPSELKQLIKTGLNTEPQQTNGYKTILILGVDSVANKPDSPELTDTMLLVSINMNTGTINTLSLPRDLWSTAYQTRINALYEYGKERYPDRPEQFSQEVISEITGVTINHTITVSLQDVAKIIDILGGITVDVTEGFTDTEFPRENVDLDSVKNAAQLYETVTFEQGPQKMDGATVLKYIRSRKSSDLSQGTDIARSQRQQQVISALLARMQHISPLKESDALAELYLFYSTVFEKQFAKTEVIATLNTLRDFASTISVTPHAISIYPEDKSGVITNPPVNKYKGQWVYEIRDLSSFQTEVQSKLTK